MGNFTVIDSSIASGASHDAFGRLRVSSPLTQFDYQNQYNEGSLIWSTTLGGTGAITHNPNTSTVTLSTGGTASGAKVYRQLRQYQRYAPGKSLEAIMTFTFGTGATNCRKRVGYFDNLNGIFLQQSGTALSVVLRSSGTGSVVDTVVNQANWSDDRLDGTGPSGVTLDVTKAQILMIDVQWLGVGTVRCNVEYNGQVINFHNFHNANLVASTYMTTANLPIRYEIENIGITSGTNTMTQICSSVLTETSAVDEPGYYTHSASNGTTSIAVTTRRAVLTIRPKATFNSIINRSLIKVIDMDITAKTNDCFWQVIYGGTLGGTPSYTSCGTNSVGEFDIAGTTVTGGEVIHQGYAVAGSGSARIVVSQEITARYPIALDIDGANPLGISFVATAMTGTSDVTCAINFREYY